MVRVIHSLYLDFGCDDAGIRSALVVPLDRQGMAKVPNGNANGRPRPPKCRTIDLRDGDYVLCQGRWRRVERVSAYRSNVMPDEVAAEWRGDGYLVRSQ